MAIKEKIIKDQVEIDLINKFNSLGLSIDLNINNEEETEDEEKEEEI